MSDELTKFVDEYLEPCQNCAKLQAEAQLLRRQLIRIGTNIDNLCTTVAIAGFGIIITLAAIALKV